MRSVVLRCLTWLGLWTLAWTAAAGEYNPRVVVWDPVRSTREVRLHLDLAQLDQAAAWLREGECQVDRLTAAELDDPQRFSAATHDALVLPGDAFPLRNVAAIRRFTGGGGVLVALGARVPFLYAIAEAPDGTWELTPREPLFGWENPALHQLFGVRYRYAPDRHDLGVDHTVTALFGAYLPGVTALRGSVPGRWLVPAEGGSFHPLLRSQRVDGVDTTPQLFIAQRGPYRAIFCLNAWYTDGTRPERWPHSRATVLALARLAADLRHDRRPLLAAERLDLSEKTPPPEPLRNRLASGAVAPEGATPLAAWGQFNGNSLELGALVGPGETVAWTAGQRCPRGLAPGARLLLPLPPLPPGPVTLRVRGAYAASGPGLAVRRGQTVLWREQFRHPDADRPGHDEDGGLGKLAAEFTRLVYLPPGLGDLVLENPGTAPLYFDALQVEQPAPAGVAWALGLDAGDLGGWPANHSAPPVASRAWPALRVRYPGEQVGPPGEPQRWDSGDATLDRLLAITPALHVQLAGTPAWAALDPGRQAQARALDRPTVTAPAPAKYGDIVRHLVERYGDRVASWEVWHEAESGHGYDGPPDEYADFFRYTASLLRELQPSARLVTASMTGDQADFIARLAESGALRPGDLIGCQPTADRSSGWDLAYGLFEGSLYARGIALPVACRGAGFAYRPHEWLQDPPEYTPRRQRDLLNSAVARLLASGVTHLTLRAAGGDGDAFGLLDEHGRPRPAYAVAADYLLLGQDQAVRQELALAPLGPAPLRGVYAAAARHADGRVTLVVNPAELLAYQPPPELTNPTQEFATAAVPGVVRGGHGAIADGCLRLAPSPGQAEVSYHLPVDMDLERWPLLELAVPDCAGPWRLALVDDERTHTLAERQGAGRWRVDLGRALGPLRPFQGTLILRTTKALKLDYLRFLPPDGEGAATTPLPPAPPLPVVLRLPLPGTSALRAHATSELAPPTDLPLLLYGEGADRWGELHLSLTSRTVIRLAP